MSFNSELLKDGQGRAIRIDASLDKFATIAYRWGDVAGELDGANQYSSRVLSLAPVRRGLGQNRVAAGGTCELVLANADGALDALAGRESINTQYLLRLRIYVCLYTPGASPLVFTPKLLGEFTLTGGLRQSNELLTLPLGDDVMGAVAQQAALPTLQDWHLAGSAAVNPLFDGFGLPETVTEFTPVQLAFGEDWVLALPHILPFGTVSAAYQGKIIVPVCCTRDLGAGSPNEIESLRMNWFNSNSNQARLIDVPRTVWNDVTRTTVTVWSVERSPALTKDGKTFKVIYLVVRADLGVLDLLNNYVTGQAAAVNGSGYSYDMPQFAAEWSGGYPPNSIYAQRTFVGNSPDRPQYAQLGAGVLAWYVKGTPLSARTQTTQSIQHPVDVLTDLVSYYSNNTSIVVNATEGARVKVATASAACTGVVQPWTSGPRRGDQVFRQPLSLRQVITSICQSSDIDVFIDWSGQFSFATDFWDFRIASSGAASWSPDGAQDTSGNGTSTSYIPAVIPETWLKAGTERWIPSDGERWAPFNRLWLNGGKANPGDGASLSYQGPWDFGAEHLAAIPLATRVIEATMEQGWRPFRQQQLAPWFWRQVNVVARDLVRFRTHIGGLQLELGQYFALSWTRGPTLGGPYSGTIFQCESLTYSPGDDTVEVTAVWRNDITTEKQYILDDETLLVRSKGALTGTATEDGGTNTVFNFGGTINLITMGVAAGDILIIREASESAERFLYNQAYRIAIVSSAITLECVRDHTLASHVTANAEWSIVRGATTYPTAISDPATYPLGGDQYGKVTGSTGLYSNAATGNRLISG